MSSTIADHSRGGEREKLPERRISSVRRQLLRQLKFLNGPDNSLVAVEFETAPTPSILYTFCEALCSRHVCIVDSATRITPKSLFQRFHLSELDGSPICSERRREIEELFYDTFDAL